MEGGGGGGVGDECTWCLNTVTTPSLMSWRGTRRGREGGGGRGEEGGREEERRRGGRCMHLLLGY